LAFLGIKLVKVTEKKNAMLLMLGDVKAIATGRDPIYLQF